MTSYFAYFMVFAITFAALDWLVTEVLFYDLAKRNFWESYKGTLRFFKLVSIASLLGALYEVFRFLNYLEALVSS